VILAIIVLIVASITYAYVESIRVKPDEEITTFLKGKILDVRENRTITYKDDEYRLFDVFLQNNSQINTSYPMFFYNLYPPLDGMSYQLYYDKVTIESTTMYRIVRVDLL
jgi:hypothetical protein